MENNAAEGDPTAIGLSVQLSKPDFVVTLYLLSDILYILTSLLYICQSNHLNLLGLDMLVSDKIAALDNIKKNVFSGGFMSILKDDYPDELAKIDKKAFQSKAEYYLSVLMANLHSRFPHVKQLSLLGLMLSQNVSQDNVLSITELADMSGPKLWNEYQSYVPFALG